MSSGQSTNKTLNSIDSNFTKIGNAMVGYIQDIQKKASAQLKSKRSLGPYSAGELSGMTSPNNPYTDESRFGGADWFDDYRDAVGEAEAQKANGGII